MHLPPPSKPPPSYSRLFCFLTASRALAPHNPFSPSRHHDTPKMHLTSCCFSAWYCSVTSSLLHLLKTQIPTTGSRTDPAPFPASPARLCQPGPATLPLLFLEWALPKGICTCGSFCLESLRVPSCHLGFSSNITSLQRLSNILESHKQHI